MGIVRSIILRGLKQFLSQMADDQVFPAAYRRFSNRTPLLYAQDRGKISRKKLGAIRTVRNHGFQLMSHMQYF